jgi:hypothetical protein
MAGRTEASSGSLYHDCTSMSLSPPPQLALMSLALSRRLTCRQLVKASKRSPFQNYSFPDTMSTRCILGIVQRHHSRTSPPKHSVRFRGASLRRENLGTQQGHAYVLNFHRTTPVKILKLPSKQSRIPSEVCLASSNTWQHKETIKSQVVNPFE